MINFKMSGDFGNTLFKEYNLCNCNDGLTIIKPMNGYYCVIDNINNSFDEYHENHILVNKKRLLKKQEEGSYKVFFISDGFASCKGYLQVSVNDIGYDNINFNVHVSYDYKIKVAFGRVKEFISFIKSNNIYNSSTGEVYQNIINNLYINPIIKKIVNEALSKKTIEEVENDVLDLSKLIKEKLNSYECNLYNCGLEVTDFAILLSQDFKHKSEKEAILKNEALKKRVKVI